MALLLPLIIFSGCFSRDEKRHLLPAFEKPASPEAYMDTSTHEGEMTGEFEKTEGEAVSMRVMFLEESETQGTVPGKSAVQKVFMGREELDPAEEGGEDAEPLYFSIADDKADYIYKFKRGDILEVKGMARRATRIGKKGLHVIAQEIKKVEPKKEEEKAP
jgi:hypothetical protein